MKDQIGRRFITISAAAAGAFLLMPGDIKASTGILYRWKGVALGAEAEMLLNIPDHLDGQYLMSLVQNEVNRLEKIFSLYRADSELTFLNENGYLPNPSLEMIDLLSQANHISRETKGLFDVTIQPLWQLYQERKGSVISDRLLKNVNKLVGYEKISISNQEIRLKRKGMALTLNGIAQGYITDKIADLLASHGLSNCLVQMGETRALGLHPTGRYWDIGLQGGAGEKVKLKNASIATSGTMSDQNFFIDPVSGQLSQNQQHVSVVAKKATLADGLSTAISVMNETEVSHLKKKMNTIRVYIY